QCPSRFALACSRSVDAHYRESEKSGKCFLKNNFQLITLYTSRVFFQQKTPFLYSFWHYNHEKGDLRVAF
ncbi:hypothetical protein AB7X11_10315, partial [Providencia alcalifaciens]